MKRVCIVTGSRADYGLLRWVIRGVNDSSNLKLQLVATGMHLSPEFGFTVREIEEDGFQVDRRVEMLLSSDTSVGVTKSLGLGIIGFADAFEALDPDLVLLLGDRYEIFAAATAAMIAGIPIAHLHGGEATEGACDEAIRHSITKMSHLHFVAAEEYRQRVIQLGEQPRHVFTVGGLGVDSISRLNLLTREEVERALGFKFIKQNLLITFHPVTLKPNSSAEQMNELLNALSGLGSNCGLIFTMPNADTSGRMLFRQVEEFCRCNANAIAFSSLGQLLYFSCVKYVDGVVGNSSSGLLEVPSFRKGSINIGDRQKGRLRAKSVIDCLPHHDAIQKSIEKLFSEDFQLSLLKVANPYGAAGASDKVVSTLERTEFSDLLTKPFYNIKHPNADEIS